ncbi:YciI family protein [Thermomonas sp.]|uniref:YciI family protein n=1 Tax=Thermomonas sp. TaxID=1971895 RepID=UPI0035B37B9A
MNTTPLRHLVLVLRRPGFDAGLLPAHAAFLDGLRERGVLDTSGGFTDGSGGAYLLRGIAGVEEARRIAASDPLAVHGASDIVVHEWKMH